MTEKRRPNFLLLFPDEQRYDSIAAAGFPWMITPNLDRLVKEGCLFPNAYSPNPVCVPARHCLLTGSSCKSHGFYNNSGDSVTDDGHPVLPRTLSDHGYFAAAVGKMHFKPTRRHHGFEEMHLMEERPSHFNDDQYLRYLADNGLGHVRAIHGIRPYIWNAPQLSTVPDEHHGSKWVADTAIDVIDRNADRPFFLMCGFIAPHPPFNVPRSLKGIYADRDLPQSIPPDRKEPHPATASLYAGDEDTLEERRAVQEAYFTMITHVDQQVGRILDHLDAIGELDNTFILYTSDHGEMLGDHGHWGKTLPLEAAAHIPFVCRWPEAFAPGSVDERFVDLCDIFPTFLDAASIDLYDKPANERYTIKGASFLQEESDHRDFNTQWCEHGKLERYRWIMCRNHRYKYVYYYGGGFEQFYDLREDPQETTNLVTDGELPREEFEHLKATCMDMEERWGPPGAVRDGRFITLPHKSSTDPRHGSKFPRCGLTQLPRFGTGSPEEEANHLADDFIRATEGWTAEELRAYDPDGWWTKQWHESFRGYGGTEAIWKRMMQDR